MLLFIIAPATTPDFQIPVFMDRSLRCEFQLPVNARRIALREMLSRMLKGLGFDIIPLALELIDLVFPRHFQSCDEQR